jgi:transcriptional regulator with XRE-family HTH domain
MTKTKPGRVYMRLHKDGRKRLAKLLLIQGVSHRELASSIGWKSHGMIGQLLKGTRTGVDPEKALAMCNYLAVDVSDLFLTEMPSNTRQVPRRTNRRSAA